MASYPYAYIWKTYKKAHGFVLWRAFALNLLFATSNIDQWFRNIFQTELKIVGIHSHPAEKVTPLPKAMLHLEEDVRDHAIAYGSGNIFPVA